MTARKRSRPFKADHRCHWAGSNPYMVQYHDHEWGKPVHDDRRLFEMLLLEGAQAGLRWDTILRRREGYRRAFAEFDPVKVAKFDRHKTAALLNDAGIIRNRLKEADCQPVEKHVRRSGDEPRKPCPVTQSHEARLSVRRKHDRLCVHAGGWNGQ